MEMPKKPLELHAYLNRRFTCDCGREHAASLRAVRIGKDALNELPGLVREMNFQSLYLISDPITYGIAGKRCAEILTSAGIKNRIIQVGHLDFDEATVGELVIRMPADCDLMVAVGTGAINDMTRYFSFRLGRPFFTVATAAPMDGFASNLAVLNINHLKTSIEAQSPTAIIGDTEILKNAPYRMIAAGLGDLLGKSTCLCDWKLSRLINGEHYCGHIVDLVENGVQDVLRNAEKARERDPEILGRIMENLVLTGVAMSMYGNSRPASGCEHHISHYWEMMFEQAGKRPAPHGTQVGVGTVLILKLAEQLRKTKIDFDAARAAAWAYDPIAWESAIHTAYGPAADGIIEMEAKAQKNATAARLSRIAAMEACWDEITALLEALPSSEKVMGILRILDSPCLPGEIGVDNDLLKQTLLYCKEVRPRYTILQLIWDLGLLDALSDAVIEEI